jgi:plastocyanin
MVFRWWVNHFGVRSVYVVMMMRRRLGARVVPLVVVGLLGVAGCGSASTPAPPPTGGSGASASASASGEFTVKAYKFPAFTASPGQKLTLVDGDSEPHTVTADDGSFDSGSFDNTAPGSLVAPAKPGTYAVHCTVHPSMHGTLTVT